MALQVLVWFGSARHQTHRRPAAFRATVSLGSPCHGSSSKPHPTQQAQFLKELCACNAPLLLHTDAGGARSCLCLLET